MDINFIFSIVVLIFSVILHELSHGIAAELQGDPTPRMQGRLTLNPFAHLDLVGSFLLPVLTYNLGGFIFGWAKPVEFNPYNLKNQKWGEAIVAIAGPLTNFLIALVFGLALRFLGPAVLGYSTFSLMSIIVLVNISLMIFNLIPIAPLDGSKILFSLTAYRFPRFRDFYEKYSLALLILFLVFGGVILSSGVHTVFSLITGLSI